MGICQQNENNSQRTYSTKALIRQQAYQGITFYFSTENLNHTQANCLMIFCDKKNRIKKNQFLLKLGKITTNKVYEFTQSYLIKNNSHFNQGNSFLIPIIIPELKFKYIAITCLPLWDNKFQTHKKILQIMINALQSLFKAFPALISLVITQFGHQLGIPINISAQIMAKAIANNTNTLKIVTIVCENMNSQSIYMNYFERYKKENKSISKLSDIGSVYY